MGDISSALTILSSMITPAVLILACGSLLLTTSQRLSRSIDRIRNNLEESEKLSSKEFSNKEYSLERRKVIVGQIYSSARRSRLLQDAMTSLYLTLAVFVATSMAIGIVRVLSLNNSWVPIIFGMIGIGLLFYSCILLILESRIAYQDVHREMDLALDYCERHFPEELGKRKRNG